MHLLSEKIPSKYDPVFAAFTTGPAFQRMYSVAPTEERDKIAISFLNSFVPSFKQDRVLDIEEIYISTYSVETRPEDNVCISQYIFELRLLTNSNASSLRKLLDATETMMTNLHSFIWLQTHLQGRNLKEM